MIKFNSIFSDVIMFIDRTMKNGFLLFLVFLLPVSFIAKANNDWKTVTANPEFLHRSVKQVTDVIVHDIYSPPVASRIYAYVTIAAYEAGRNADPQYRSFAGQLHGLTA